MNGNEDFHSFLHFMRKNAKTQAFCYQLKKFLWLGNELNNVFN